MKKNKKIFSGIKKKLSVSIFILLFIFSLFSSSFTSPNIPSLAPPAQAFLSVGLMKIGSSAITYAIVEKTIDFIFTKLGVDETEFKKYASDFNASRYKKTPPQVSVTFTPLDPSPGQKVTATATPTYFLNDTKDLYFTWFLKTSKCKRKRKGSHLSDYEKKNCDLDNDGDIDINDYKIKAMRIIANGGFDWKNADYKSGDHSNDGYQAYFGGNDQAGKNSKCYVHNTQTGREYKITCSHLFAHRPGSVTGDNKFGISEEEFWHTDPNNTDTAGTGNPDEANVAGLGINQFKWNYEPGDEVGVAVEGVSIEPTQDKDSSYRTMWALSKNDFTCSKDSADSCRSLDEITNGVPDNSTLKMDASSLNEYLYNNLIDPTSNGKLGVTLTYSPQTPINDPHGKNGDELTVNSSVTNAKDIRYLHYNWQVYQSDEANPDSWEALLKSEMPGSSQTVGLGLSTFKLKLNFSNLKKYLRIKLTVSETTASGKVREGNSDIVIPINSNSNQIKILPVSISPLSSSPPLYLNMDREDKAKSLCPTEESYCPVSKDEIIGAYFPMTSLTDQQLQHWEFLWTINGKPFTYQSCFFNGCKEDHQVNFAYFPILEDKGEHYTINLLASNSRTGEKINVSKTLVVVEPKIKISSADKNVCKPVLLGYYKNADGTQRPDNSQINFQALAGQYIKLKVSPPAGSFVSPDNYVWTVDGNTFTSSNASSYGFDIDGSGILTLPPKSAGENYTVSVATLYTPDNLTKQALNTYWNVPSNQLYEQTIADNINIAIVDNNQTLSSIHHSTPKILANLYSATPAYLVFLLKIALTTFLILVSSGFILSLFPKEE